MKFLSTELFAQIEDMNDEETLDDIAVITENGGELPEKSDANIDDDLPESEKTEDQEESTNCFEALHANFARSRRLKSYFFEEETLVF